MPVHKYTGTGGNFLGSVNHLGQLSLAIPLWAWYMLYTVCKVERFVLTTLKEDYYKVASLCCDHRVSSEPDGGEWDNADMCQAVVSTNEAVESGEWCQRYRAADDRMCELRTRRGDHHHQHRQRRKLQLHVLIAVHLPLEWIRPALSRHTSGGATSGCATSNDLAGRSTALARPAYCCALRRRWSAAACSVQQWRYTRVRQVKWPGWKIHLPGSALPSPAYCFASVIVWTENKNVTISDRFICFILTVKQHWQPVFWGRQLKKVVNFQVTWLEDFLTSFTALVLPLHRTHS